MPPYIHLVLPLDGFLGGKILGMLFKHLEKSSLLCFDHKLCMGTGIYHLIYPAGYAIPPRRIQSWQLLGNMDFFRPKRNPYKVTHL